MKRNNNQVTIMAIIICLACVVSGVGQTHEEKGHQYGENSEKELWVYSFSKKINPLAEPPTDARGIARNTLLRYANNESPLYLFGFVVGLSSLLGVEIEIDYDCRFLEQGNPFWPKNMRRYEINYGKDSAAKGFIPWSKADNRLRKAQNTKNAEQFLKTVFRHITWEQNVIKVCPCGYDLEAPSKGALWLMKQLEKESKQGKCPCCK